ncbi:outer membrane biogenesis protein BamB [Anatilimnocola aggregata]|uniref:Outer membrane biogenesis protein BamB n=1 Tax=Anatilimnocola aggregata TaxID=2528021 RepID=A0A517Y618_9BACT|nr:PQQ-binding-like beta-propeller repeat protein [Anatilimnocola aggregata]QDU25678.1 outer membrane biogenesis protein BamB [Anatilimnocola aggregata]
MVQAKSVVQQVLRGAYLALIAILAASLIVVLTFNDNWYVLWTGNMFTGTTYPPVRTRKASFEAADETAAQPVATADWPGWTMLFGPRLSSCSPETGLNLRFGEEGPRRLWQKPIGTGYSAPVVAKNEKDGGDLVLLFREENQEVLACYHAENGEERWRCSWPTSYQCPYEYSSGPYATPIVDGEQIYAVGAQGQLHCVARESGEVLWQRLLQEDFQGKAGLFGYGAGLLIDDEKIYLNVGGVEQQAGIVAFDKKTGDTLWKTGERNWAYTTPRLTTIGEQRYLLVLTDFGLAALEPASGKLLGEYEFHPRGPDVINAVTPVVQGDRVLLVTGPGPGAVCLQLAHTSDEGMTFKELWQDRRVLDSQFNSLIFYPQLNDDTLIFGFTASQQGGATFRCVDFGTGELKWKHSSELGRGQALAADGHILLLGEHGHLQVLPATEKQPEPVSSTKEPLLAAPCYSQPALCNGLLFVRNEREVICFDLRK